VGIAQHFTGSHRARSMRRNIVGRIFTFVGLRYLNLAEFMRARGAKVMLFIGPPPVPVYWQSERKQAHARERL
jgi:hypothetical protein